MNVKWIVKLLTDILTRKFYGKLTIQIENGKIVNVKQEESLRLE